MQNPIGVLLPDDGPDDYEWRRLGDVIQQPPPIAVGRIESAGLHQEVALRQLGRVETLLPQARSLVERGCVALIWACTSASFIGGLEWARDQSRALSRATGVPVSSTSLAFGNALLASGWRQIDLLSPYPEAVTQRLIAFFRGCGIGVRRAQSLNRRRAANSHAIDLAAEIRAARQTWNDTAVPIVTPDTAINTLGIWWTLAEAGAGKPVVTANQVTLWQALALVGWRGPRPASLGSLGPWQ